MDRRDCGAYKAILGAEHTREVRVGKSTHATQLGKVKAVIGVKYPMLKVETRLMALDGKIEVMSPHATRRRNGGTPADWVTVWTRT